MRERRITTIDVVEILTNPKYVKKESESSQFHGKYNYRVMGKYEWSVVVSIYYEDDELAIVTVID